MGQQVFGVPTAETRGARGGDNESLLSGATHRQLSTTRRRVVEVRVGDCGYIDSRARSSRWFNRLRRVHESVTTH
jgi:hypothetical protein